MTEAKKKRNMRQSDIALLSQVTKHISLEEVRLSKVEASCSGDTMALSLVDVLEVELIPSCKKNVKEKSLIVNMELHIRAESSKQISNGMKPGVRINGSLELRYRLDFSMVPDDKCIEIFADINAPINAWPYLRELVQSLTSRMGIFPITLPVFHPGEAKKKRYSRNVTDSGCKDEIKCKA